MDRANNHEKIVLFSLSIIETCPEEEEFHQAIKSAN